MKKHVIAVALTVVFVMALAVPVFGQQMNHTATYEMEGAIDFRKQAGHLCNTGAEYKQTIQGSGEMEKVQTASMQRGILTMDDQNDYIAGEAGLTVTSVIELCAPPKYTYEDAQGHDAVVHPAAMYQDINQPYFFTGIAPNFYEGMNYDMWPDYDNWDPVSNQIWAVQVAADPGYSGNLHQDFTAAYGAYDSGDWGAFGDEDFDDPDDEHWAWANTDWDVVVADDYVGNYFDINQHARTSMGEVRRYIDISSPWSHGYLMEDMSVVGESDIEESFNMTNLSPGADVPGLWWDLF